MKCFTAVFRMKRARIAIGVVSLLALLSWNRDSLSIPLSRLQVPLIGPTNSQSVHQTTNSQIVLINSSTPCSFDTFRQHMSQHNFLPSGGKWNQTNGKLKFVPDVCKFSASSVSSSYFKQCLTRNRFRKLLIMGDSNGKQYYSNLLVVLKASGFQCQLLKGEGGSQFSTDAEYFTNGTSIKLSDVRTQTRGCRTCKSEFRLCTEQNADPTDGRPPLVVTIEFILMEFYLDAEMITFRTGVKGNCPKAPQHCTHSNSYQEFIFMEYLKDNYPDLVIIFGNSHSIRRKQFFQIKPSMEMLASIVQNTVPKTNPVVWMSGAGEYEQKRPGIWKNDKFGPNNDLTAQEMIHVMNNALFQTLKPSLLDEHSNMFAFFDLQSMSNDMLAKWSVDGVHMQGVWYQHVMAYLIQSLCNSDAVEQLRKQT